MDDHHMTTLNRLSASEAAQGIRAGRFSSEELVEACLAQIEAREDDVRAWSYLDGGHALRQAREADRLRAQGMRAGPLQGVPVGIKDIIDTADMPTERGTALHSGRQPARDAWVVAALRRAGAIILGKTVTTEMATYAPGKTRNPHNVAHTPGGSSSGSAAAVAADMVPLAVGTQTNGSVIRPAAYCGVVGFKPTRGLVSCRGILEQSPGLDQPGCFARTVGDIALLAEVMTAVDPERPGAMPRAALPLQRVCDETPAVPPVFGFVRTPWWDDIDADARDALALFAARLGERAAAVELPADAASVFDWHKTVMEADIAASYVDEYERGRDRLSDSLRAQIERGRATTLFDYRRAQARIAPLTRVIEERFDGFDALIAPAAHGAAPNGLESTGSPMFCTLWTFCGMPTITLPLLTSASGLPIGVQLIGRVGDDARLLRAARWLHESTN
jgi:Asp-tRNA(Asn)/Glu-tRNA(Gln) amidotransferase A subunit family amidase